MPIEFNCEQCGKGFRVENKHAGKKAKCSGCKAVITVPHPAVPEVVLIDEDVLSAELRNDYSDGIQVTCTCGHQLKMPYEKAGIRIECPACLAELLVRDEERVWSQDSKLLSNETEASKPGAFRLQYFRYAKHYPLIPGVCLCLMILAIVLWTFGVPLAPIGGIASASIVLLFLNWKLVREQCYFGDLNPGIVLEICQFGFVRLAVFTDLTKGTGHYPVIKVLRQRVTLPDGRIPQVGMKLSMVSIYRGADNGSPHWVDFSPKAVVSLTDDPAVIQMTISQFSEAEWQELNMGVASLEQPLGDGLHFLQPQ